MTFTIEDLNNQVRDCHLEYAVSGIEVGDPLYEWDLAHHPAPKCLGGTETTLLLRKDHAVHGVMQSEVYQYPCIYGWEAEYLEGELYDLCKKWQTEKGIIAGRIGGRLGGKIASRKQIAEGIGIFNPDYRKSEEYIEMCRENGEVTGRKNVEGGRGILNTDYRNSREYKEMCSENGKITGRGNVEEGRGIMNPDYMTSEECKKQKSDAGKIGGVATGSQKWMCLSTGHILSPGPLSRYQKSRGIDTSRRVKLTPEETAFIFLWA